MRGALLKRGLGQAGAGRRGEGSPRPLNKSRDSRTTGSRFLFIASLFAVIDRCVRHSYRIFKGRISLAEPIPFADKIASPPFIKR